MRILVIVAGLGFLAASGWSQSVRVGTFEKQAVVVGFYRSPQWSETIKAKMAERDEAKRAGDTKRAEELEKWGAGSQELAHQQLAGDAPIANILAALAPAFPEIARKAQVAMLVAEMPWAGPAVVPVDVTGLILDYFKADEQTRAIVKQLPKKSTAPEKQ
jgi:hypothetical protein